MTPNTAIQNKFPDEKTQRNHKNHGTEKQREKSNVNNEDSYRYEESCQENSFGGVREPFALPVGFVLSQCF